MSDGIKYVDSVEGRERHALSTAIDATVTSAIDTFKSNRLRGPYPYPCAADLARSAYLRELARWLRVSANRSARSLGPRLLHEALQAASNLAVAAALLDNVENAPNEEAAQAAAAAGLSEIGPTGLLSRRETRRPLGSLLLDHSGYLGELIRSAWCDRVRPAAMR